jgi:DNA-binding MarR family transcriptional regulator/GNAT superfamily N-acetyltransferase
MGAIEEVRQFNRFYTKQIGLLDEHLANSRFTLAEARVLYELARQSPRTAADLSRELGMDKAHLSRLLGRLRADGLVATETSPLHAKHQLLSLTEKGQAEFRLLEGRTISEIETLLAPLDSPARDRLLGSMRTVRRVLGPEPLVETDITVRAPSPGDLGWIIHRQSLLYTREHGWDSSYETLMASVVGAYDPETDRGWIAEADGEIAGSVFLMKGDDPAVAKLRLLYVESWMRGLGLGSRLVSICVEEARSRGYRTLTLWTVSALGSARRIYEATGFTLRAEETHPRFGTLLTEQTWALEL